MNVAYDKNKLDELVNKAAKNLDDGGLANELKNMAKTVEADLGRYHSFIEKVKNKLTDLNDDLNNNELEKIISDMNGAISG